MNHSLILLLYFSLILLCSAWTSTPESTTTSIDRRRVLSDITIASGLIFLPSTAAADTGLGYRLAQRDPSLLRNRIFNIPPAAQVFPAWLRGTFDVTSNFQGYLFPSTKISRERLTANSNIAGFQKCSIAATADVGKENVRYQWIVQNESGLEDRVANFQAQINAYAGYKAIERVEQKNVNRISIDFVNYRTVNAERIELFCNARESEDYVTENGTKTFVHAEYLRQVTFGTGSTAGVPRQVVTNYANFWTWQQENNESSRLRGNLLTAAYLDPQDAMYFEEPSLPVAIYSHRLEATRI